jgi:hypothetical protein
MDRVVLLTNDMKRAAQHITKEVSHRVAGYTEVIGRGAHLKAKEFRLELGHAGFLV